MYSNYMKITRSFENLPMPATDKTGWPWYMDPDSSKKYVDVYWPRISIVTPSFNQGEFIEETIRSVLLQDYPNLQYIVIDGGSTDNTISILQRYSPWIDYWVSEKDRGQSHAINKGLKITDGEWFNWINSDDLLMPGALRNIATAKANLDGIYLISGRLLYFDNNGERTVSTKLGVDRKNEDILVDHRLCQPAMFYRRDLIQSLDQDLHYAMDYELWVRFICKHGRKSILEIENTLAAFRYHTTSKTVAMSHKFEIDERRVLKRVAIALGSNDSFAMQLSTVEEASSVDIKVKLDVEVFEANCVRRYLIGDLRNKVYHQGVVESLSLLVVCIKRNVLTTVVAYMKALVKRWLRIPLK